MKAQSLIPGKFSFALLLNGFKSFIKLITWKNIWKLICFSVFFLGIICGLWLILTVVGSLLIGAWAMFGTTYFSGDDGLSQITTAFWRTTTFEKIMVLALAVNSINHLTKIIRGEQVTEALNKLANFFDE